FACKAAVDKELRPAWGRSDIILHGDLVGVGRKAQAVQSTAFGRNDHADGGGVGGFRAQGGRTAAYDRGEVGSPRARRGQHKRVGDGGEAAGRCEEQFGKVGRAHVVRLSAAQSQPA